MLLFKSCDDAKVLRKSDLERIPHIKEARKGYANIFHGHNTIKDTHTETPTHRYAFGSSNVKS